MSVQIEKMQKFDRGQVRAPEAPILPGKMYNHTEETSKTQIQRIFHFCLRYYRTQFFKFRSIDEGKENKMENHSSYFCGETSSKNQ